MSSSSSSKGFQSSMILFNKVYEAMPMFTDVFDEESFYIFAFFFVVTTILVVIILSRFITIKEFDDI